MRSLQITSPALLCPDNCPSISTANMSANIITDFTPLSSFIGGVMIGLSALLVLFLFGRVAGISGITRQGLLTPSADALWRCAFLLGLVGAPWFMSKLGLGQWGLQYLSGVTVSDNMPLMAFAGLAVGVGTIMGSGCTSGHGVCGLGRRSIRSAIAVAIFMLSAAITVAFARYVV